MSTNNASADSLRTESKSPHPTGYTPKCATGCVYKHTTMCTDFSTREEHTVIVRSDGAFTTKTCTAGFGYHLKSQRGTTLVKGYGVAPNAASSMDAESVGLLTAIELAQTLNPSHIVCYTDCQPLIEKITNEYTETPPVVRAITGELDTVPDSSVVYPRTGVETAHTMAQRALDEFNSQHNDGTDNSLSP